MESTLLTLLFVAYFAFSAFGLLVAEKATKSKKLSVNKQLMLFLVALVSAGAAWGASQVFIPLAFLAPLLVVFVGALLIAKLSPKKSAIFAIVYSLALAVLVLVTNALVASILHIQL